MQWTDESQLLTAVAAGSQDAFRQLVEIYEDRVFRLMSRFTRDPGETEDLAQEVFVKVFRKVGTFQRGSAFFTWLYRIAVNTATDYMSRKKRRHLQLVENPGELDVEPGPRSQEPGAAQPILDAELRQVTRDVLASLPEKYRTVLVLREYEELSYNEIAEVLQCNLGTVESRLFRARQRFKEAMERRYPDLVPPVRGV
jgi:RNA polymerase sigma-70 factor (ECF subfamily)